MKTLVPLMFMCLLVAASCSKDATPESTPDPEPVSGSVFTINDKTELKQVFQADQNSGSFTFISSEDWKVNLGADARPSLIPEYPLWITLSVDSGKAGENTVEFLVEENDTDNDRVGFIHLMDNDFREYFSFEIVQKKGEIKRPDEKKILVSKVVRTSHDDTLSEVHSFDYDELGRVVKYTYKADPFTRDVDFTYESLAISSQWFWKTVYSATTLFVNTYLTGELNTPGSKIAAICKTEGENGKYITDYNFVYDGDLIRKIEISTRDKNDTTQPLNFSDYRNCWWEDGNLVKIEMPTAIWTTLTATATYNEQLPNNPRINLDLNYLLGENTAFKYLEEFMGAVFGMCGARSRHMIDTIEEEGEYYFPQNYKYIYTLDAEGLISEIIAYSLGKHSATYTVEYN